MGFAKFITIDIGPVPSGSIVEKLWESDEEFRIRRIFFVEKAGNPINAVEVTIRMNGTVYAEDYVPAVILSHINPLNPELDISITKGTKIVFGLKNNETGVRNLYAVLELWR